MKSNMKSALASLLFALPSVAAAVSRRADEDGDDGNNEVDYYEFLQNYEQVYVTCSKETSVQNEEGEYEYSAVVYRLCPTDATCSDNGRKACDEGYGDYVVGIQTYVRNFLEQFKRENEDNNNQNQDDAFDFDWAEFGECREFDVGQDDDANAVQYFIGPACTDEGDVKLALFTDEDCKPDYESLDVTFEDLTGFELPYADGGLMDQDECKAYYCYGQDEDGNYDYNEFCVDLVDNSPSKCEEKMEFYSPYGQNVNGCELVASLLPEPEGGTTAGDILLFVVFFIGFVAVGLFFVRSKRRSY